MSLLDQLSPGETLIVPGVFDAFTARVVESLGFGAVYLGGYSLGAHLGVGQPLVTLTETMAIATTVARAISVPVIVDGEAGFGGPAHVHRLVHECTELGVAAVQIDDQPYPKSIGYLRGEGELLPAEDAGRRVAAAVAARGRSDTAILARTDTLRVTGDLDDVVRRCNGLAEAGADLLMVLDLEPEQLAQIRSQLPELPVAWIGGVRDPGPTRSELADAGFALACYPFNSMGVVASSVHALWSDYAATGAIGQSAEQLAASRRIILDAIDLDRLWEIESGGESEAARSR